MLSEKARLLPSRLFDKSLRGRYIERSARYNPGIYLAGQRSLMAVLDASGSVVNRTETTGGVIRSGMTHSNGRFGGHLGCENHSGMRNVDTTICRIGTMNRWYYHADSVVNIVDNYVRDWFHGLLVPGTVWTGNSVTAVSQSQRLKVKPLKSSDWPRSLLGPSWPSFPSIPEWMEMIRRGINPEDRPELRTPEGHLGFTQVSRGEVSRNSFLATRIVSNYVVGLRSSTEVPSKYLKYFRYSQDFLILMNTWSLPIGLVRFLLALWCQKPYSLWLRRSVFFKKFLKKVPISLVRRARLRFDSSKFDLDQASAGSFTTSPSVVSDILSENSDELD